MMKKRLCLLVAFILVLVIFSGCGKQVSVGNKLENFEKTTPDSYPIETDETISWWMIACGNSMATCSSMNETPHGKALMEQTGINVEYIHPAVGQESEQFNLLVSSGNLPDIIEYQWGTRYPGGADQAIKDGIILPINDIIEKVSPNLHKFYVEHPDIARDAKTNEGYYYGYPIILEDDGLKTYKGPMVRADLLEKAGLELPETVDDWDKMLRVFKEQGIEAPITLDLTNRVFGAMSEFASAYGIVADFYIDNGVVKYGPIEPEYKDVAKLFATWYSDGLLDKNFTDRDFKRITALVSNGQCGSAFASGGGEFGNWIPLLKENVPDARFVPVKYPVMNKGDRPMYGQKTPSIGPYMACISKDCKNIELAARLLDYGYTQEGQMLYNFGIEGESYTIQNGEAIYTDIITDDKKNGGLGIGAAMGRYIRGCCTGPFIQNIGYLMQFYALPEQREAVKVWSDTDALDHMVPSGIMNAKENKEYSTIMADIDVYREEFFFKVVTGHINIDEFDTYLKKMKDFGIERAIELQQQAYDRYLKRK